MKTPAIVGVLLIILGVIAFAYQGFTYTTTEKAIDLGPIQVTAEKTHTFPLPPVVGAIAIVGGIFLLATSGRKA
jgi:membrane-bound ClpP family serine protease